MRWSILGTALALAVLAAGADEPRRAEAATTYARTIATIRGNVVRFAQNERYLAWLSAGKCALRMQDLRTRARIRVNRGRGCGLFGGGALVVVRGRAYWDVRSASLLTEYSELFSASPGDPRLRRIGYQSHLQESEETLVTPESDARSVYYWTSPEDSVPGPLVRYDGLRKRVISATLKGITGIAAGGGRLAYFRTLGRKYDCVDWPAWSPDGARIAYASTDEMAPYEGAECKGGLWIVNADGSGERRIDAVGNSPDWAPDGSKIAYESGAGITVAAADGSDPRVVVPNAYSPSWSPDGSQLAFTRTDGIHIAASDGTGDRFIGRGAQPDWSPDGARLVFVRNGPYQDPHLYVVNVDGSGLRRLTSNKTMDWDPSWSPDGRTIAFTTDTGNRIGLSTIKPDGSGRTRARCGTPGGVRLCTDPSWAPDSRRLAWVQSMIGKDQEDFHLWAQVAAGSAKLSRGSVEATPIVVGSRNGRSMRAITPRGEAVALAVTGEMTAALVDTGTSWEIEIYGKWARTARLPLAPAPELSASGRRLVLRVGRTIYALDARNGSLRVVAHAAKNPVGLSIAGRRVAWAENVGRGARVRSVVLAG